jgi:CRP/FNR family transcriptional regulator, cyclic AMP receptor protein
MSDRDTKPIDFLSALSPEELSEFQELGSERSFRRGEAIFREGDDPGGVVVILSGRAKVAISGVSGRDVVLAFPGPGELIGELSATAGRPRTATVAALDNVEAITMRADQFRRFVSAHPRVASVVFEHVAALLAEADRQRVDFATRDVTARIANRLVELAGEAGEPEAGGLRIALPLSQEELAAWTGASREAVARSLHLLRELGWVETGRREIRVLNADALRMLVL